MYAVKVWGRDTCIYDGVYGQSHTCRPPDLPQIVGMDGPVAAWVGRLQVGRTKPEPGRSTGRQVGYWVPLVGAQVVGRTCTSAQLTSLSPDSVTPGPWTKPQLIL